MFRSLFAIALVFASTLGAAQTLPWPDASPLPPLDAEFARRVHPPVVLSRPGMDKVIYTRDVAYTRRDNPNIRMDVYRPADARAEDRRGAVIFIHGGADAVTQPKNWGIYQSWGRLMATTGLVGVTMSHSLSSPRTRILEGAADITSAIDHVRANAGRYGIDPDRICLIAFSAGGPLLAPYLRGAAPGIRCLAGYYPFMDIRQSSRHQAETAATLDAYSPIVRLGQPGRAVPLLLVRAGRDDIPTLLDSVDRFAAAALAANYPLTLINHPEAPHGFDNQLDDARSREVITQTLDFLQYHLR